LSAPIRAAALDDLRVARGMEAQLSLRRGRLAEGARPIGWKLGFGAPAAMERLGLAAPLVGFLTDRSLLRSGETVSLAGFAKPVAEPEVAVHIGRDLESGADEASARAAIDGLAPAIELADLDPPPDDVAAILAGNIYHRHVLLGPKDPSRAGARLEGLTARVRRNGAEIAATADVEANTGRLIDLVRHVADVLAACGERLRAGEFIIAGSVVPPLFLDHADREIAYELAPVGAVGARFSWD
jgi:2-keto-4-pentenoate hydratase